MTTKNPLKISSNTAEFVGILLGDGSISIRAKGKGQNRIKITFNSSEKQYIDFVSNLMENITGIKPILKFRKNENTADLFLFKKEAVEKMLEFGLKLSPKRNSAEVPYEILNSSFDLDLVRGYFDTDGSVIITNNNGTIYPRLEMKVCPSPMQTQIPSILQKYGFRFGIYNCGNGEKRIQMNGKGQLEKWTNLIGFHNEKHGVKARKMVAGIRFERMASGL